VRSVLISATHFGPNSKPVFDQMMRSIDHRPALVASLFPDLRPVAIGEHQTRTFSVDLPVWTENWNCLNWRYFGTRAKLAIMSERQCCKYWIRSVSY